MLVGAGQEAESNSRSRVDPALICLQAFMALVFMATSVGGARILLVWQSEWQLYDWLISYDAGLVRRGLSGTLLLPLARVADVSPAVLVWGLQVFGYGLFLSAGYMLMRQLRPVAWQTWPVAFSPFLFAFQAHNPNGGFRKETVLLAGLAVMAVAVSAGRAGPRGVAWSTFAFVPLALLHEMLVVFLPYLLVLPANLRWRRLDVQVAATGVAASLAATALVVLSQPTAVQARTLCRQIADAVDRATVDGCLGDGAVSMLAHDTGYGAAWVRQELPTMVPWVLPVLMLVAVGLAPAAVLLRESGGPVRPISLAVVASLVASLPLFVVAIDWGRFIYLHAALTALVVLSGLASSQRRGRSSLARPQQIIAVVGTLLYATTWNIHHFDDLLRGGLFA